LYQKSCDLGVQYGCEHLIPNGMNSAP
jgi:hypothetical protein